MKKFKQFLRTVLPHIAIAIAGMFVVFYFIDNVNPIMNFIYHDMTEGLLLALSVVAVINALLLISGGRRSSKRGKRRAAKKRNSQAY